MSDARAQVASVTAASCTEVEHQVPRSLRAELSYDVTVEPLGPIIATSLAGLLGTWVGGRPELPGLRVVGRLTADSLPPDADAVFQSVEPDGPVGERLAVFGHPVALDQLGKAGLLLSLVGESDALAWRLVALIEVREGSRELLIAGEAVFILWALVVASALPLEDIAACLSGVTVVLAETRSVRRAKTSALSSSKDLLTDARRSARPMAAQAASMRALASYT